MKTKELKKASNEELLQWYANADKTSSCGGHWKGQMNENYVLKYSLELRSRNIEVPSTLHEKFEWMDQGKHPNVDIPEGIFNGMGSY